MVDRETILKRLAAAPVVSTPLGRGDFPDKSPNTQGTASTIAELQASRPIAFTEKRASLALVAYEKFTNSTGDATQTTYDLTRNLVKSPATGDNFVLYQGNSLVQPDSVDYSADSFNYTDDGSGDPLHVYYTTDAQAQVEVRKVAPSSVRDRIGAFDVGRSILREQGRDPLAFDFDDPLDGVVPAKWKVQVRLTAPYRFQWADDTDTDATASNVVLRFPIRRSRSRIEDLDQFMRRHAAED